jgi:hypothetical protein
LKRIKFLKVLPVIVGLLLIFAIYQLKLVPEINGEGVQCQVESTLPCIFDISDTRFSLQFLQSPEVEEELKLQIEYPDTYSLSKAWVQGVNMYMGKSAVLLDSNELLGEQLVGEARIFLGACSEKNMQWQLITVYIDTSGQELKLFYNFDTQSP